MSEIKHQIINVERIQGITSSVYPLITDGVFICGNHYLKGRVIEKIRQALFTTWTLCDD